MKTKTVTDFRSPLAKARDQWMQSKEGLSVLEPSILKSSDVSQFLANRIEIAFLAGASWGQRNAINTPTKTL
jgi:ABC-type uncharacterized transport system auxiliary subunit